MKTIVIVALALLAAFLPRELRAHTLELSVSMEALDFSDITLQDQTGRELSLKEDIAEGQRLVITFQFTSCKQLCLVTSEIMASLRRQLPKDGFEDVRLLSVTLDPEGDTPELLAKKASEYGEDARWLWLTGQSDQLAKLYRQLGFVGEPKESHDSFFLIGRGSTGMFQRVSGVADPKLLLERLSALAP
jgi:protein SCO1